MGDVGKGFSPSAFGNRFEKEVREGCTGNCRGKPATIQELARFLVAEPNHCGVAKMLRRLSELTTTDCNFADVKIDCRREFWEAIRLGDFDTADAALRRLPIAGSIRGRSRPRRPSALSIRQRVWSATASSSCLATLRTFPDKPDARCLLYVALSRARAA